MNLEAVISIILIIILTSVIIFFAKRSFGSTSQKETIQSEPSADYTHVTKASTSSNHVQSYGSDEKSFKKYNILHKNNGFRNNMNMDLFQVTGVYSETNRKRTREYHASNESTAKIKALSDGFTESILITKIDFPSPTLNQLETMRNHNQEIPMDACKHDISAIISCTIDNDSIPNPDLINYATSKDILFSNYIGKKALYNLIWNMLNDIDKIAFFLFCIYRYNSNEREGNLEKSPHKATIYSMSNTLKEDPAFLKSMNKYTGDSLRFFGNLKITKNGYTETYAGGSTNTLAYNRAVELLHGAFEYL